MDGKVADATVKIAIAKLTLEGFTFDYADVEKAINEIRQEHSLITTLESLYKEF